MALKGSFPLEVFLPVALLLAMLGCFLVTRDDKDAKNDAKAGAKSVANSVRDGASTTSTASMFAPSEPKARQGRPHEFQASAKSQGPQPTLINICPNLVVPEKVRGFHGIPGIQLTCSDMGSYEIYEVQSC